ncbi:MAG: hypothetical protein A2816_00370 [Candidatus Yanofskybacteria bacterium RIFCSPHIGHO2_01_FULL_39_44]|nr:MAG: hypothetical protein A2816_00370 [Candidatus Yanofskybacteria bacterium RIFCSPHIGHO2_01_FULL_39_44]
MDKDELQKLSYSLKKRLAEIDKELSAIASENPLVRGDFNVKVEDIGSSQEDAEQEAGELDRNQAMVTVLEKERKEIVNTLEKIEAGSYGKCEKCSVEINPARLKIMPIAALCINCAQKKSF